MTIADHSFYPGEGANPEQMLRLADEYKAAAEVLRNMKCGGERAPFRLLAIHAIELYLNAWLSAEGHPNRRIRGLQHDLMKQIELVEEGKLRLRKLTLQHLRQISLSREYLVSRYQPSGSKLSELNRLEATLNEIARKISAHVVREQSRRSAEILPHVHKQKGPEAPTPPTPFRPNR